MCSRKKWRHVKLKFLALWLGIPSSLASNGTTFTSHSPQTMPSTTKRRRSTKSVADERQEEEDLVASLFGGKRSRRVEVAEDGGSSDEEEQVPSDQRTNAEQYLDDDKVCRVFLCCAICLLTCPPALALHAGHWCRRS